MSGEPHRAGRASFLRSPSSALRTARAFTLVELLVVIAIIAVLITIVVAVSSKAFKSASRTQLGFQMQIVEQGLEAYKSDFNGYPITSVNVTGGTPDSPKLNEAGYRGARMLCKALFGPEPQGTVAAASPVFDATRKDQDGADGPGFRVAPRSGVFAASGQTAPSGGPELGGKTYGPYVKTAQFKFANTYSPLGTAAVAPAKNGDPITTTPLPTSDDTAVLLDANGHPILYYPVLNTQPSYATADAYVAPGTSEPAGNYTGTSMFRSGDNDAWLSPAVLRKELGCGPALPYGKPSSASVFDPTVSVAAGADNRIVSNSENVFKGRYILWSPGPDGVYGPDFSSKHPNDLDDVNNIQP